MPKPLGYFCQVTPGNLFDELQNHYGCTFEHLTRQQKLYLLVCVASDLCCLSESVGEDDLTRPDLTTMVNRIQRELELHDKESLMLALVHHIREQKEAPKGHVLCRQEEEI